MYTELQNINQRPEVFSVYTARELWDDVYTSGRMLEYHLNKDVDISSRNGDFLRRSLSWIANYFAIGQGSAVCDFGCAVGHYSSGLARLGATVTGLDFSRSSLTYAAAAAERDGLDIDYRCMNYLDFSADSKFDLLLLIMCDYCALSPQQRGRLLGVFRDSLADEGSVLLDVYSYMAFDSLEEKAVYEKNQLGGFWAEKDYYAFVNTFKYPQEKVGLDKYTIIEPQKRRVIYNWLQYFSVDSLCNEFADNGFEITGVYGDVAGSGYSGDSAEFAVVARKV